MSIAQSTRLEHARLRNRHLSIGRLLALWLPQKRDYLTRALDPEAAPTYGAPGNR
jgi:hypothetical protein